MLSSADLPTQTMGVFQNTPETSPRADQISNRLVTTHWLSLNRLLPHDDERLTAVPVVSSGMANLSDSRVQSNPMDSRFQRRL